MNWPAVDQMYDQVHDTIALSTVAQTELIT